MDVTHWNISDRRCLLRKMCSSCFIFLLQEPHTHSLFWMRVCGRRFTVAFPFHIPERQWQNNGMAATTQVDKTFPFVVLNVGHTCYYDDYCPRIFGPSQHLGCCFSSFAPAEGGPFVWLEMRRIFPLKEWVDDLTLSPSKKKRFCLRSGRQKKMRRILCGNRNEFHGLISGFEMLPIGQMLFPRCPSANCFQRFRLKRRKRSKCRQVNKLIEISESHFVSDLIMNRSRFLFDCISTTDECTCNLRPVSSTINAPTGGPIRYFVPNFFQLIDFPVTREDWEGSSSRQALGWGICLTNKNDCGLMEMKLDARDVWPSLFTCLLRMNVIGVPMNRVGLGDPWSRTNWSVRAPFNYVGEEDSW